MYHPPQFQCRSVRSAHWVISSAVEHCLHTAGVTCSIHVSPTNKSLLNSGSRGFFLCHAPALGKQASSSCMEMPGRVAAARCCHALGRRARRHSLDTLRPSCSRHGAPRSAWCDEEGDAGGKWGGHYTSALSSKRQNGKTAKHCTTKRRAAAHGVGPENHVLPPPCAFTLCISGEGSCRKSALAGEFSRKSRPHRGMRHIHKTLQPSGCCGNTGSQRNRLPLLNLSLVSLFL